MAAKSSDALKARLHQLLGKLVHWLEPEQLAWRDRDDSSVDLDGVEIDEEGSVSVNLSFHGWLWVNLEELMELVHRHAPAEVTEARSILEKLQNQPAPAARKKTKKSRTRR